MTSATASAYALLPPHRLFKPDADHTPRIVRVITTKSGA
jgi:hypothetical protein